MGPGRAAVPSPQPFSQPGRRSGGAEPRGWRDIAGPARRDRPGYLSRSWARARAAFPDGVLNLRSSQAGEPSALRATGLGSCPGKGAGKVPCSLHQPGPREEPVRSSVFRQIKWVRAHSLLPAAQKPSQAASWSSAAVRCLGFWYVSLKLRNLP